MIENNYGNNAGACVVRDYEVFIDSNCSVPSESVDEEIDAALDVANTVATHASGQCGVVGHLFPFPAPFGNIQCSASDFTMTNYEDFECTKQVGNSFVYPWGQCVLYPWTSKGVKYIRLYQNDR